MSTLYERLGGEAAVEAAVVRFYDKIMADAHVAPFFDGIDLHRQVEKQIAFMTVAFGGPNKYTGRDLRVAHARSVARGLGESHFAAVAGHLQSTLQELKVDPGVIAEVMAIVGSTKKDVLNQ